MGSDTLKAEIDQAIELRQDLLKMAVEEGCNFSVQTYHKGYKDALEMLRNMMNNLGDYNNAR